MGVLRCEVGHDRPLVVIGAGEADAGQCPQAGIKAVGCHHQRGPELTPGSRGDPCRLGGGLEAAVPASGPFEAFVEFDGPVGIRFAPAPWERPSLLTLGGS